MSRYLGWGKVPNRPQTAVAWQWGSEPWPQGKVLAFGNGRSYGDECLCSQGTLVDARGMNRLVEFDAETGLLTAQAGVTLGEINAFAVPRGWMLAVNPGTQYVTLGGAIANDVHGKNHHRAGSFGHHVREIVLRRSDSVKPQALGKGDGLFAATIGGMGLTGIIIQASVQLMKVGSAWFDQEVIYFESLADYVAKVGEIDARFDYSIGWVDVMNGGRGFVMAANHAADGGLAVAKGPKVGVPFTMPFNLVTPLATRAVGQLYYNVPRGPRVHYGPYFYYIDGIHEMRRVYGPRGFIQVQVVVPVKAAGVLEEALRDLRAAGSVSYLNAIKVMGKAKTPAMLSFPRPGITLAMDLPYKGEDTLELARRIGDRVVEAGGALYPAKDAAMTPRQFAASFANWNTFAPYRDKAITSDFIERVLG